MRIFYDDEGPIDTLLQISEGPVWDGDLVSKCCRDALVDRGWVDRCQGYNILTPVGNAVITTLRLKRMQMVAPPGKPFVDGNERLGQQASGGIPRPTIAELEAILNNPNYPDVVVMADGSVRARNAPCR
jgi:hypothetical protein